MTFEDIKNIIENSEFHIDSADVSTDGRINSSIQEQDIFKHLQALFGDNIENAPKNRYWYDCKLTIDGKNYYINIKSTEGSHADNVSSKKGLFYTLTGLSAEDVSGNLDHWGVFIPALVENYNPNTDADYYFVVYFKNSGKFLFTSLKRLQTVTINSNNLPFQCNWKHNISLTERSVEEQCKYLMETFITGYINQVKCIEYLQAWKDSFCD